MTAYHRLARESADYRWWRAPVGLGAGLIAYITLSVVAVIFLAVGTVTTDQFDLFENFLDTAELQTDNIWLLGIALVLVAFMLPSIQLGRFAVSMPHGDLWSVEGRLRWKWLAVCSGVAAVVYGAVIVGVVLLDGPIHIKRDDQAVLAVLVVLATVPLQATAEEVVFRGHLMQLIASWTRWAVVPVVLSTLLFVVGHTYDLWGLIDVGLFGITAAVLAIRTGGLEAPIAAHVANNVVLLLIETTTTSTPSTGDFGPIDLWPTALTSVLMLVLCEVLVRVTGQATGRPAASQASMPPSRLTTS